MLRYVPRLQKPLSVMVWAGISASGRTPLVFVPSGVKSHKSIESLKKSLVVEWEKIPQEVLRAAVEALPGKIAAVIKNKGGYIE